MRVQINNPTDVCEHISEAQKCAAAYSDALKLCNKPLASLGLELDQIMDSLTREQREYMICLDNLQHSCGKQDESQEVMQQRQLYIRLIETCRRKQHRLRIIFDGYKNLAAEAQRLQQDAENIAAKINHPAKSSRTLIKKYQSCL